MNKPKKFDCVAMQRNIRNEMVKEAKYDLRKLVDIINNRTQNNEILIKYYERKEKAKQLTTV